MDGALAILSPVVAAETSVFAQNVVTGDQPGDLVRAYCVADGTRAGANRVRNLVIRRLAPTAQADECLPHLQLKIRAADVHFQVLLAFSAPDLSCDREGMCIVLLEGCIRPVLSELS